jgi:hypothetical protein
MRSIGSYGRFGDTCILYMCSLSHQRFHENLNTRHMLLSYFCYLPTCLSVCLPICPSVCLTTSIYLSYISTYIDTHICIHTHTHTQRNINRGRSHNVIGIVTRPRSVRSGVRISKLLCNVHTCSEAHPASHSMGTVVQSSLGEMLTTHLHSK